MLKGITLAKIFWGYPEQYMGVAGVGGPTPQSMVRSSNSPPAEIPRE